MWAFPFCWRVWGCFPSVGGWGASAHEMSICSFLYSFVVHYVSRFNYGSNYYSSCYGSIFWPVFCVISDSGSFPDRVSSKLGSAWHGSTTTLDAERLWRCSWLSFCATAATSIFSASFSLCQLCYGFSTGRFLFQSWASHHLYLIYVWCAFWCLLFTFRCQVGCHIHLWGLNLWGLHLGNHLEFTHGRHMCNLVMVISPHLVWIEWLLPWVGWSLLLLILLCPNQLVGYTALGAP